ncbi:hypothetical protein P5F47_10555 [Clostridium perfringens]|nr:hypothetical protein [Clostridium perfringens]
MNFLDRNKFLKELYVNMNEKLYAFGKNTRNFNHEMNCHDIC